VWIDIIWARYLNVKWKAVCKIHCIYSIILHVVTTNSEVYSGGQENPRFYKTGRISTTFPETDTGLCPEPL
jgi:hypothetical protein